jgi:hypothetical protein
MKNNNPTPILFVLRSSLAIPQGALTICIRLGNPTHAG